MNSKEIIGSVFGFAVKIVAAVIIVMLVYKYSVLAYDLGYRVFGEEPVTTGEGRLVSVTIPEGKSMKEIGEILEMRGLIHDAQVFAIQGMLSDYKDDIRPGTYDLNTSMTPEEMIEVMARQPETVSDPYDVSSQEEGFLETEEEYTEMGEE